MPVTSTRQPVWNDGAARGLICLIAFGLSVKKVAHPWYTAICEAGSLIRAVESESRSRKDFPPEESES